MPDVERDSMVDTAATERLEEVVANAAPEWQARTLERKQEIGGGLSTPRACYPFLYVVTLLWSAS
jgi:hypothetical protein